VKSVLVIGGGVVGLFCARELLHCGFEVTLLDPEEGGCSSGNAGMIVPSHVTPLAAPGMVRLGLKMMLRPSGPLGIPPRLSGDFVRWSWRFLRSANAAHVARAAPVLRDLSMASRRLYVELAQQSGNPFGLVENGLLMVCRTRAALEEEKHAAAFAATLGLRSETLDSDALRDKDPGATYEAAGAVWYADDCHLNPEKLLHHLRDECLKGGAKFVRGQAERIIVTGDRISRVVGSEGEMQADEYVLAAGAWSPALARTAGLRLPMQAGRGYSFAVEHPPELPQICSLLIEGRVAVTPIGDRLRFAGTMEIGPVSPVVNRRRLQGMLQTIPQYLPSFRNLKVDPAEVWVGPRPVTPDGLPYLGRSARLSNLIVASGHAMMGVSLAPITGRLVAEIVGDQPSSIDLTILNPNRFG
jgi:D-amino-acid dehydrogenase